MRSHRKGMSLPQFRTLAEVDRQPDSSLSALADHLGSSLPTASRIVEGLVKKGLLTRKGCSNDRRQCALVITASGRGMLLEAWGHTQKEMEKQLSGISAADRATLVAAMEILSTLFGSAGLPDMPAEQRATQAAEGSEDGKRSRSKSAALMVNKQSEV